LVRTGAPSGAPFVSASRLPIWTAVVCGALFAVLTWSVVTGVGLAGIDGDIERVVVAHRAGWTTATLKVLTWMGSSLVLWPLIGMVASVLVLSARRRREALFLIVALGGSVALSDLVKAIVDRPRPPAWVRLIEVSGSAYPSGHAMDAMSAFAALSVVLVVRRSMTGRVAVVGGAALAILVVGWSRLYLGEHWLTDVLGGYLLGATWVALIAAALLRPPAAPARTEPYRSGPGP
jgi:undecaprenyl-diphosphatase